MEKIATREAYGKALAAIGETYENIVVLDADLSKSTKTEIFAKKFPQRFFNMGIAESNLAGTSAGLAIGGQIVFMSSFAIFAVGRGYEIIRNAICYPKLNVKIAATHAGLTVGEDGGSHEAIEDIALMRVLPNMRVLVPADGVETTKMVAALAEDKGPAYLRLGRSGQPILFDEGYDFQIGKGQVLREGKDVAIIACGLMVSIALEAAQTLAGEGIDAAVINMSSIKPLDTALVLQYAESCGALVSAEEHSIIGGLGGAVAEALAEGFPCPLERVGVRDSFGESGTPAALLEKYGLTAAEIALAAKRALRRKKEKK